AARQGDLGRLRVDRLGHGAEAQLDLLLAIEVLLVYVGLVALRLSLQVVLAEWRPLVGALGFGADEDHAAVETSLAQLGGRLGAGQAGADDHECLAHIRPPVKLRNSSRVRGSSRTR